MKNRDCDRTPWLTPERVNGFPERYTLRRFSVYLDYLVSRRHTGVEGRRVLDRRNHGEDTVHQGYQDP